MNPDEIILWSIAICMVVGTMFTCAVAAGAFWLLFQELTEGEK